MSLRARPPSSVVALPGGITAGEALFLLRALARLKERKFGRLVMSVSDGRIVDVELIEKIDRKLLQSLSS
jgi:hypothetical protein